MHPAAAWLLVGALAVSLAPAARAQTGEREDLGVPPSATLRLEDHAAPTPVEIPGARIIFTPELRRLAQAGGAERPLLFDVLGPDNPHRTLPGSIWLPGAGRGESFDDELQTALAQLLASLTAGQRERPLVFFCSSPRCWLSYNAALRAARLGYTNVLWYRGGIEAWGAGGGALAEPAATWSYR